jgi:hypothetical protein
MSTRTKALIALLVFAGDPALAAFALGMLHVDLPLHVRYWASMALISAFRSAPSD